MFKLSVSSGFSVCVNTPSVAELMAQVMVALSERRNFAVATLNLDHIAKLRSSPLFRAAYARQTFVVADGNPVVWLSRLARTPVALTPGSEIIEPLLALAAARNVPVAFMGSTQHVLDAAATKLEARYPGLRVVARIAPPFGVDPESETIGDALRAVAHSGAGLCFLAFGAPKQEIIAARGLDLVKGCGFVSVGAGLDFVVEAQKRAPVWVRRIAMEWLWRMLSDPRRLVGRYAACALLLPKLVLSIIRQRRASGDSGGSRLKTVEAVDHGSVQPMNDPRVSGQRLHMAGAVHEPT